MRSLNDKNKELGQLGGEWGWGRKIRNEQKSKTRMHSMQKTEGRTSKKEHVLHWEKMKKDEKHVAVGALCVFWVSFSVSRCPSAVLMCFWLQLLAPVTLFVKIDFRILVGLCWQVQREISAWDGWPLPPTCPLMGYNLAVRKGLVELNETMSQVG